MKAFEFRQLFAESGLSHVEIAQRLQIDETDLLKYQTGILPVPPLVEYAVLWIIKCDQAQALLSGN